MVYSFKVLPTLGRTAPKGSIVDLYNSKNNEKVGSGIANEDHVAVIKLDTALDNGKT